MNEMENFIDFLASKGVKSFHIEMQERHQLNSAEKEERTIEKPASASKPYPVQDALAKHDIPVYRGSEGQAVAPCSVLFFEDKTEEEKLVKERLPEAETIAATASEKAVVAATQKQAKESVPELTAEQANASVKADAETTGAIATGNIDPKKLYETFCAKITTDDGTFTVEERTALIGRMGLDDLLRINNDFSLGLDTDKPVEDVREDVKNCFL